MSESDKTATKQNAVWSAVANEREKFVSEWSNDLWNLVLKCVDVGPGFSLLDVGCGTGEACVRATALGASVAGIDVAQGMVDRCRQKLPGHDFQVGDMQHLPWRDATFDGVISCNAVHFASHPDRALTEMRRVLRLGGRLAISSNGPRAEYPASETYYALAERAPRPEVVPNPFGLADGDTLDRLVTAAGFEIVSTERVPFHHISASADDYLAMSMTIGINRALVEQIGDEEGRRILMRAIAPNVEADGRVVMRNVARVVVARAI